MRTTVNLRDDIFDELMRLTQERTRTSAVNKALAEWVRWKKIAAIKALRGKLRVEGDIETLREREIAELEGLNG